MVTCLQPRLHSTVMAISAALPRLHRRFLAKLRPFLPVHVFQFVALGVRLSCGRLPWNKQLEQRVRIVVFGRLSVSQRVEYFASTLAHWVHMGMPVPAASRQTVYCMTQVRTHTHTWLPWKTSFSLAGLPRPPFNSTPLVLPPGLGWVLSHITSSKQKFKSSTSQFKSKWKDLMKLCASVVSRNRPCHFKFCIRLGSRPWGYFGAVAAQLIKVPVEFEFDKLWQKSTSMVPYGSINHIKPYQICSKSFQLVQHSATLNQPLLKHTEFLYRVYMF